MFKKENEENFGIKKGGIFFSNSVEVLLEHLKVNLFSEGMDIFSERILLIPSLGMQQWIHMQFAETLEISCGFITSFLNKGIEILIEKIFYSDQSYFLPNQLELFFRIIHEMEQVLENSNPIWEPLVSYIKEKEQRKIALAKHLTQLYDRYGIYANNVSEWEKNASDWQEALWAKIFQSCDYPQRVLPKLKMKKKSPELSVHLFAFSHISPLHFDFFCKISCYVSVFFYQLSPCQEFWSDLSSDHPTLLGSLGKVGKEMAKLIEKSDSNVEESYVIFGGNTQLRQIQRDLLNLQQIDKILDDDSIQIHICTSVHQEIENLHQLLLSLFSTKGFEPKDVIVMAPQISFYAPYIQSIFGSDVNFQIADMPMPRNNSLIEGFFLLLDLEKKRWAAPAVLELLNYPLFFKKHGFSNEDLSLIRIWVQKTGTRWAFDGNHRESLLKKDHCCKSLIDESATWLEGFGHLIEELAFHYEPARIQLCHAETLGNFIALIKSIYSDLKSLNIKKTLQQWMFFLKHLAEVYFLPCEDLEIFLNELEKIEIAGRVFSDKLYDFSLVYFLLKEHLTQENITLNGSLCQAVRFCSLLPMRAIPAKVICLIGMSHDTFPRKEELRELDLLKRSGKSDYVPSRSDFDRYLFLEAIISARNNLIISYLGTHPHDLVPQPPSCVVAELLPLISTNQVINHSFHTKTLCFLKPFSNFSIKVNTSFSLPKGEFFIEIADLRRLIYSPLRHYMHFHNLKIIEEDVIQSDEPFTLSTLQSRVLHKIALSENFDSALNRAKKQSMFPIGLLGKLAEIQLQEEITNMPVKELKKVEIKSLQFTVNNSLSVIFTGTVDGVFSDGLFTSDKKSFKNAAKLWPYFLLLNATDSTKKNVFFGGSDEIKSCFFEDPHPFLFDLVEHFFYAKKYPLFFALEWIEFILKKDIHKFSQFEIYDPYLQWQIKGKGEINYEKLIEAYHPLIAKIYQGMADAWF